MLQAETREKKRLLAGLSLFYGIGLLLLFLGWVAVQGSAHERRTEPVLPMAAHLQIGMGIGTVQQLLGKPDRVQVENIDYDAGQYWYYYCQDGTLQIHFRSGFDFQTGSLDRFTTY